MVVKHKDNMRIVSNYTMSKDKIVKLIKLKLKKPSVAIRGTWSNRLFDAAALTRPRMVG